MSVADALMVLAQRRPVFHSEADLQFAFAWTMKELDPVLEVRLETHPEPGVRLDLLLADPRTGSSTAIELKYMTRIWSGTVEGEPFALKNHGAQDVRAYDVVKDIQRLERFTAVRPGMEGYLIALTNDSSYWRPATHGRTTNADAFRIAESHILAGVRAWGPNTGAGTSKGREAPIVLRGSYPLRWRDYSTVDSTPAGSFKVLVVRTSPATGRAE